jgi:hypothetical protein
MTVSTPPDLELTTRQCVATPARPATSIWRVVNVASGHGSRACFSSGNFCAGLDRLAGRPLNIVILKSGAILFASRFGDPAEPRRSALSPPD